MKILRKIIYLAQLKNCNLQPLIKEIPFSKKVTTTLADVPFSQLVINLLLFTKLNFGKVMPLILKEINDKRNVAPPNSVIPMY